MTEWLSRNLSKKDGEYTSKLTLGTEILNTHTKYEKVKEVTLILRHKFNQQNDQPLMTPVLPYLLGRVTQRINLFCYILNQSSFLIRVIWKSIRDYLHLGSITSSMLHSVFLSFTLGLHVTSNCSQPLEQTTIWKQRSRKIANFYWFEKMFLVFTYCISSDIFTGPTQFLQGITQGLASFTYATHESIYFF